MERVCEWCGRDIGHRPDEARFCSRDHAARAAIVLDEPESRECLWCGSPLPALSNTVRYCSQQHRLRAEELAQLLLDETEASQAAFDAFDRLRQIRHAIALLMERRDRLVRAAARAGHEYGPLSKTAGVSRNHVHRLRFSV